MPSLANQPRTSPGMEGKGCPPSLLSYLEDINKALKRASDARETGWRASNGSGSDDWTYEEIVFLHCLLLDEIKALADPKTSLWEACDLLTWVFTEPERRGKPFSFTRCVQVAACSPASTFPYFGRIRLDDVLDLIRGYLRKWFPEMLSRYPEWVRETVLKNPSWVDRRLEINPQCINQKLKLLSVQGDLFV